MTTYKRDNKWKCFKDSTHFYISIFDLSHFHAENNTLCLAIN